MKTIRTLVIILIIISQPIFSQSGGRNVFGFLNHLPSARLGATNGTAIAIMDGDASMGFYNPALLNEQMQNSVSLNYVNFLSDANYGVVGYVLPKQKFGVFAASLQYMNYGSFIQSDETSQTTGSFNASDYCFTAGVGKQLNEVLSVGGNFKMIYSAYETYRSFGLAFDFAGHYVHPGKLFSAGIIARNAGIQLTTYSNDNRGNLPLQTQAYVSYKPEHVPLRFLITYDRLHRWQMMPKDTSVTFDPITGQEIKETNYFAKNLFRHFIFGGEFSIGKVFQIRFGLSPIRLLEMRHESRGGAAGFSAGAGFRISKFNISYGWARYHFFGASHMLSLQFRPADFYKKTVSQ